MQIKNIMLNKDKKVTTLVIKEDLKDIDILDYILKGKDLPKTNKAIQVKCADEDAYDPYIGVALALAEAHFGSKRQFRMWVDKRCQIINSKEKKEKITTKNLNKQTETKSEDKKKSKKVSK